MGNSKSNAIEKALQILKCFSPDNRPLSIQDISKSLDINRTTVHRIVQSLVSEGFLQREGDTAKVSLGETVLQLGCALTHSLQSRSIVEMARPHLENLRDKTGCVVALTILSGSQTVFISILRGRRLSRLYASVGEILPWHTSAGAKAALAFLPEKALEPILRQDMPSFTPNTITDVPTYLGELKTIRRRGYAYSHGETQLGINAVAAPFFNYKCEPAGAVIAIDVDLDGRDENSPVVKLVKKTAHNISKENFSPVM